MKCVMSQVDRRVAAPVGSEVLRGIDGEARRQVSNWAFNQVDRDVSPVGTQVRDRVNSVVHK